MFERFHIFRQEANEIKLEDIPEFLEGKFRNEKTEMEAKLSAVAQDIRKNFMLLKDIAIQMKSKSSQNRYANMLKDKFCDKAIAVVQGLPLTSNSYDDMKKFIALSKEAKDMIGEMGIKEFRHLHEFRDDMSKIAEKARLLESCTASGDKIIKNSPVEKSESIRNNILLVAEAKKKIGEIDAEILELEGSLQPVNNLISSEKKKIEEMNTELATHAVERLQIRDLEKSLNNIKQQVDNEFSGMDRVMKKFVYFGELTKEETHMLKEYIEDPGDAFLLHDKNNLIRPILDAIYNYKDKQMIDLDSRKLEKLKDIIRQFDFLIELRKHHQGISQKKEECEERMNKKTEPIKQGIKLSVLEISSREKDLSAIVSMIDSKKAEKKGLERQIMDKRNKVEIELSGLLGNQARVV